MKKSLIFLLCALFVVSAFTACANNPQDTTPGNVSTTAAEDGTETEPVETEDPNYIMDPDTVAKADQYKGETLTILANSGFWPADDIFREKDSDDPIDSAIYNRNLAVTERYGFNIEVIEDENVQTTLKNAFKSGISDYDVAAFCAYEACPLAAENIFQDLTTIENLDLKKHYWDQGLFEGLSIDNKLFYITGDISTKANAGTFLMMFNKKLARDYDLEDLYQVVREDRWTLDYLNGIIKEHGYQDRNGNSQVDVEDTFGFGIQIEAYLALFFGAGGRMVLKDAEQMPYLDLNTEKNIAIIDKIYDLTRLDNKTIDAHDHLTEPPYSTGEGFASTVAFKQDRCIFYLSNAANIIGLREMDSDFGVLPTPKYDSSQKDYYSYVYHGAALYVIPVMNKRTAFTGFALEALAAESYKTVTPAYYEQTLKRKSQRDADSWDMLDIVFRNRLWDLGYYARWGSIDDLFIQQIKKGTSSFAKWYKSQSKSTTKAIDKYVKAYKESAEK